MRRVRAFAPGHVTGFFAILDEPWRLALRGSIGSGFSVELGANTEIAVPDKGKKGITLIVDGKVSKFSDYPVMREVVSRFKDAGVRLPSRMVIRLSHDLPIGAGFGMSASGALSLALALDAITSGGEVPSQFAHRVAHEAEVACRTGLGDVIGEVHGGFEIRTSPGIQGVLRRLPISGDVYLFARDEGISTKRVLTDQQQRRLITEAGARSLREFIESPTLENFVEISRRFAVEAFLATNEVLELIATLGPVAYAGMVMLGRSVYAFPRPGMGKECEKVAERIEANGDWRMWKTRIAERGAFVE